MRQDRWQDRFGFPQFDMGMLVRAGGFHPHEKNKQISQEWLDDAESQRDVHSHWE